jgi:hypothetical protein
MSLIKKEDIVSKAIYMYGFGNNKYVPLRTIEQAEVVDAVPVVHGYWVFPTVIGGRTWNIPHCSACDGVPCGTDENTKYCSICGAKMDLKDGENNG